MSLKFEGLQISEQETIFVRDVAVNPKPDSFTEEDAIGLITCPNLLEAARDARLDTYRDKYCQKCFKTSVKWIPSLNSYQISGKCPNK